MATLTTQNFEELYRLFMDDMATETVTPFMPAIFDTQVPNPGQQAPPLVPSPSYEWQNYTGGLSTDSCHTAVNLPKKPRKPFTNFREFLQSKQVI